MKKSKLYTLSQKNIDEVSKEEMDKLIQLEEIFDDFELSIEKSISLYELGVNAQESFSENFNLLNDSREVISGINDVFVKEIAISMQMEALALLQDTIFQLKNMEGIYEIINRGSANNQASDGDSK